jgi:hypothetical protein
MVGPAAGAMPAMTIPASAGDETGHAPGQVHTDASAPAVPVVSVDAAGRGCPATAGHCVSRASSAVAGYQVDPAMVLATCPPVPWVGPAGVPPPAAAHPPDLYRLCVSRT